MKKLFIIIAFLLPSLLLAADLKLIGKWSCEQYGETSTVYNSEVYQMDGFILEIQRYNSVGITGPLIVSVVWQWDRDKNMYTTILRFITQIWNEKFEGTFQSFWNDDVLLRTCTIRN